MPTLDELIQQQLSDTAPAPVLPELPRQSPSDGTRPGWLGLLGEVLGGGQSPTYRLRGQQEDAAGSRALLNFGINMLMASGPQRVRPDLGSIFGAGLQGAQQSLDLSQRQAAAVAQQDYQQRMELAKLGVEQGRDRTERLKNAITLLQLQNRPVINPDGSVSTSGGTVGTTTAASPGAIQFTGDKAKDEALIIARESKGNPTALNYVATADPTAYDRGATASGLYGFTNQTWQEGLAMVGGDAAKYPTARSAPAELQKQVFNAIYDKRGTAPWDPSKWGQNWQKQPDGTYQLVKTPATPSGGPPGAVRTQVATATPTTATDATPAPVVLPVPPALVPPQQTPAPDATIGLPPGVPTREQFLLANPIKPTPEEEAQWHTPLSPEQEAGIKEQRKQLEQAADAARQAFNAQVPNSEPQYTAAKKALADAVAKAEEDRRLALKVGEDRKAEFFAKERDRLTQTYQKLVEGAQTRLTQKEAVQNEANKQGLTDAQKELKQARDVGVQLEGFSSLSEGVGQPGWLQTTKNPFGSGETIAEKLGQMGIKVDDTGGVQLLRGGMTQLVRTLREGMPMGALSDRDLSFIERMGPTEWMDPHTRAAAVGYLKQAFKAKQQFASEITRNMSRGMAYGDAFDAADAKVGKDFVPRAPEDISQHWDDKSPEWIGRRNAWIRRNAPPGTFYHLWDGSIMIQGR